MLVGAVDHVGASRVSDDVQLRRIKSDEQVLGELLHHVEGPWPIEGDGLHVLEIQVHMAIVDTQLSEIGSQGVSREGQR